MNIEDKTTKEKDGIGEIMAKNFPDQCYVLFLQHDDSVTMDTNTSNEDVVALLRRILRRLSGMA